MINYKMSIIKYKPNIYSSPVINYKNRIESKYKRSKTLYFEYPKKIQVLDCFYIFNMILAFIMFFIIRFLLNFLINSFD